MTAYYGLSWGFNLQYHNPFLRFFLEYSPIRYPTVICRVISYPCFLGTGGFLEHRIFNTKRKMSNWTRICRLPYGWSIVNSVRQHEKTASHSSKIQLLVYVYLQFWAHQWPLCLKLWDSDPWITFFFLFSIIKLP